MIRLCVPGTLEYRDLAVRVVAAACKLVRDDPITGSRSVPSAEALRTPVGSGVDEFDSEVISAFGEAFNNVCIHGYSGRLAGEIDIEIETDSDEIVVWMRDTGESFDPTSMAPPSLRVPRESGMGIFIMRSFMDVTYEAGSPNVLCLRKHRQGGRRMTTVHDDREAKGK